MSTFHVMAKHTFLVERLPQLCMFYCRYAFINYGISVSSEFFVLSELLTLKTWARHTIHLITTNILQVMTKIDFFSNGWKLNLHILVVIYVLYLWNMYFQNPWPWKHGVRHIVHLVMTNSFQFMAKIGFFSNGCPNLHIWALEKHITAMQMIFHESLTLIIWG